MILLVWWWSNQSMSFVNRDWMRAPRIRTNCLAFTILHKYIFRADKTKTPNDRITYWIHSSVINPKISAVLLEKKRANCFIYGKIKIELGVVANVLNCDKWKASSNHSQATTPTFRLIPLKNYVSLIPTVIG